jgi:hypothetical protein
VAHVPDDLVTGRIEHPVERERQLDDAEVRRQVSRAPRHGLDDDVAQLGSKRFELRTRERLQIGGRVDALEQAHPNIQCQSSALATPRVAPTATSKGV